MLRSVNTVLVAAAATILLLFISCHSVSAQSRCSKYAALQRCFPETAPKLRHYVNQDATMNVSRIIGFFASREVNLTMLCMNYNYGIRCVEREMYGCHGSNDAWDNVIYFWDRTYYAVDYLCNEKLLDFINARMCLTPAGKREGADTCDMRAQEGDLRDPDNHLHCGDYERAIHCADDLVTRQCGEYLSRVMGVLTRALLRASVYVRDCREPEFWSAASSVMSSFSLSVIALFLAIFVIRQQ